MIDLLASIRLPGADELPAGYATKGFGFALDIWPDASFATLTSVHAENKGRLTLEPSPVPNMNRSNNPPPLLACDTSPYVLGDALLEHPRVRSALTPGEKDFREAPGKHAAFRRLLGDFASASGDTDVAAFEQWCNAGRPGLAAAIDALSDAAVKRLLTDPVAIKIGPEPAGYLHEKPTAQAYWSRRVLEQKSSGLEGLCLGCGTVGPLVDTLPQSIRGVNVPGTQTAQVALISANFPSAGRTHSGSTEASAFLCGDCASRSVANLNALAADEKHCFRDPAGTEATIWFSSDAEVDDAVYRLVAPDAAIVTALLASPGWADVGPARGAADGVLQTLTFSGNIARFVPRSLTRTPIRDVRRSIRAWFQDTATTRRADTSGASNDRVVGWYRLTWLAAATGPLRRASGGKWDQHTPHGTSTVLFECAVHNRPIPPSLVNNALQRARAESHLAGTSDPVVIGRDNARLALMRLHLNRTIWKDHPVDITLDDARDDPAYLAGRVFALRAELQENAHYVSANAKAGDGPKAAKSTSPNAGIVDKYFSRAMQSPRAVNPGLATLTQRHIAMIKRANKGHLGWSRDTEQKLGELLARLGDRLPGRLSLDDQAAWLAGFYQQQHQLSVDTHTRILEHKAKQNATPTQEGSPS